MHLYSFFVFYLNLSILLLIVQIYIGGEYIFLKIEKCEYDQIKHQER